MKKILITFLLLAALAGITSIWVIKNLNQEFLTESKPGEPIYFEIKSNQGVREISRNLVNQKIISNSEVFYRYVQFTGKDRQIKKGVYQIPPKMTIPKLADLFVSGLTATLTVTIPEGRASWEIYSILNKHFQLDSLVFDSLIYDKAFIQACGIQAPSLEGYLYPDTYQMPLQASEIKLLKILTTQFWQTLNNLKYKDSYMFKKHGLNGLLTMASIVEEEAAVRKEQKEIAGVFINRLKKGWPLGADPTVRFAIKKLTGPLYVSELRNNSPYNTRKFKGLPPGPISNPGKMAILAVMNPNKTDNMFFVAKDDGSREHNFAKSLRQHNQFKVIRKSNNVQ